MKVAWIAPFLLSLEALAKGCECGICYRSGSGVN